ncbi:reverse transcriptase domain-containing protein [Tanacetum coccineum]
MADNRTMAQMLQAPIEGYEDAIVVPPINANNFELKQPLINLVQSNKFTGRQDPHNHLRFFNKVTSTFRHPEVPNTLIKLLLFPFSLDGEARDWLDKEPPRSILTWDDLVLKFINQFFPPSKTTYLRNKITTFYQEPNETFNEAWERFKELLRQCPHHGFSELHQLDTFYNSLNTNDQDALDSAAGGNFLDKMPREGLAIIESKSKVCYSRSRLNDSRAITNAPSSTSSPSNNSFEIQQMAALLKVKNVYSKCVVLERKRLGKNATTPATVKAVKEVCVTCGSNHNFNNCPLTRNDFPVFHDNIHQFQQTAALDNFVNDNPPNLANQMRPRVFIDLYEETLTLRVGNEELVYYADKSEKNKNKHFVHAISVIDFSKDDPFSGSSTTHYDVPSPSSSPMKTSDNLRKCFFNFEEVLCEISTSQSHENVHANQSSVIESFPISPIPVEDSEPAQEEIDIFLVPDDLIPPGAENDDSEDEDNELPNLDHQDDPSIPRPPPEPPDVEKCFEPEAGILITKVFKGLSKPHNFMADILPTLPTLVSY